MKYISNIWANTFKTSKKLNKLLKNITLRHASEILILKYILVHAPCASDHPWVKAFAQFDLLGVAKLPALFLKNAIISTKDALSWGRKLVLYDKWRANNPLQTQIKIK